MQRVDEQACEHSFAVRINQETWICCACDAEVLAINCAVDQARKMLARGRREIEKLNTAAEANGDG